MLTKLPSLDSIPGELFKLDKNWRTLVLTTLFTAINASGKILDMCHEAIIVPIHKKSSYGLSADYYPVGLLSIPGKL